jgi:HPt (histidine-containing phosphotransfer) domain-containing protein
MFTRRLYPCSGSLMSLMSHTGAGQGVLARQQRVTAKQSGGADGVLDHAHLSRYTLDDTGLEREIVGLFLMQLPILLDRLLQANSLEEWKFASHALKGSSAAIGACKINALARQMEAGEVFQHLSQRRKLLTELKKAAREFEQLAQRLYRH